MAERIQTGPIAELYPERVQNFIQQYGAKAGLLQFIQQELPDIPQSPMICISPDMSDESISAFLPALQTSQYLVRSSGYDELEVGSEGKNLSLPATEHVLFKAIQHVRNSNNEPKPIILTELQNHDYLGTMVIRPGVHDAICALEKRINDISYSKAAFQIDTETAVSHLSQFSHPDSDNPEVHQALQKVYGWHWLIKDKLGLEDMNYQLEFGVKDGEPMLYQIRPFLKDNPNAEKVTIDEQDEEVVGMPETIVFGSTDNNGITKQIIRPADHENRFNEANENQCIVIPMTRLKNFAIGEGQKVGAFVIENSIGPLTHEDVRAIRQSQVAILLPAGRKLNGSGAVTIHSDGAFAKIDAEDTARFDSMASVQELLFSYRDQMASILGTFDPNLDWLMEGVTDPNRMNLEVEVFHNGERVEEVIIRGVDKKREYTLRYEDENPVLKRRKGRGKDQRVSDDDILITLMHAEFTPDHVLGPLPDKFKTDIQSDKPFSLKMRWNGSTKEVNGVFFTPNNKHESFDNE